MKSLNLCIKSGIFAAFFLLCCHGPVFCADSPKPVQPNHLVSNLIEDACTTALSQDPTWLALIHYRDSGSMMSDRKFLLSAGEFSPKEELVATIGFLYGNSPSNVCRFPARYHYLHTKLNSPQLPLDSCPDVSEFREKAPINEVYLLFASENLTHPASMLGHSLIKLSGTNEKGQEISHVVSFYTDTETLNIPKLFFESVVTGREGIFALTPYQEKAQMYLDVEQRKLWEYKLNLNAFQKELIGLHLLELKYTDISYYFQKNNCATIVDSILALSGRPQEYQGLFSTPVGVVKHAHEMGLVTDSTVIAPDSWLVNELQNVLPPKTCTDIADDIMAGQTGFVSKYLDTNQDYLAWEFANSYLNYQYKNKNLDKDKFSKISKELDGRSSGLEKRSSFSIDALKNPANAPASSQVSISANVEGGRGYSTVSFIPVSHTLFDDNRIYNHETSLEFFSTTVAFPYQGDWPRVESFRLYSVESLLPSNSLTGGLSGKLTLGYEPRRDRHLQVKRGMGVDAALGVTRRIVPDIDVYALAGGGGAYIVGGGDAFLSVDTGFIVRELWDMKSVFNYQYFLGQVDLKSDYHVFKLHQSKFINSTFSLHLEFSEYLNSRSRLGSYQVSLKALF